MIEDVNTTILHDIYNNDRKKGKRKKSSGNPPTKILVILSKLKKLIPFTTNNKNKVLKGINKFVQEVCNYGKQQL